MHRLISSSFLLLAACAATAQYTHTLTRLGLAQPNPPGWSVVYVYSVDGPWLAGSGNQLPSNSQAGWIAGESGWTVPERLPGSTLQRLLDVNAHGQAVGYADTADGTSALTAILVQNGVVTPLGSLGKSQYLSVAAGGAQSRANAINDNGQVVGVTMTDAGTLHAFLYENGQMRDLGALNGGSSEAFDINNTGVAVGNSGFFAVVFENGGIRSIGEGKAIAVNDSGVIAGVNNQQRAFVFVDGVMTDIGTLGGPIAKATGVNALGQVVGTSLAGSNPRCFLYENGVMRDLATLADFSKDFLSPNCGACAIDDAGRIYGFALNKSFANELFVLTPVNPPNPFGALAKDAWRQISGMGYLFGYQTGTGWAWSPALGLVHTAGYPWLYLSGTGWLYHVAGDLDTGAWFYAAALGTYVWTSTPYLGWASRADSGEWIRLF